eukprot:248170-Hanusia_phi.AAC.1
MGTCALDTRRRPRRWTRSCTLTLGRLSMCLRFPCSHRRRSAGSAARCTWGTAPGILRRVFGRYVWFLSTANANGALEFNEIKLYSTEICPAASVSGVASTRCSQGVYCPGGTGTRGSLDHAWDLTTVFGDGGSTCNPGSSFSGSIFSLGLNYIYVFDTACTKIFRIHQATWRYEAFTPTVTLVANTVLLADMTTDGVYIALEDCIYYSDANGNAVLRYGYCGQKGLGSGLDNGVGTDARFNRISVMVWSVDSRILLVDYTMDVLRSINVSTDDVSLLLTDCCPSSKPALGLSQDYTGQDILIGCHDANRIV